MAPNDLTTPLYRKGNPASTRRPVLAATLIAAAALIALVAAVWIAVVDDPDGGRSVAVAVIKDAEPAATGSLGEPSAADAALGAARSEPFPLAADEGLELAALPAAPGGPSAAPGLLEQTAFGPLPRIAPDGRRPREAYARRAPAAPEGAPRIVLVVGGMGLSQTGTQKAIEALPEDITLAFAPYGSSLQRWVDKARAEGHEVLLQIPLEPVGYPEENPGEHTLLVSTDRRATAEDLAWVLARMTSYAGVMNYMGGRFLSDSKAMAAVPGRGRRARAVLPRRRLVAAEPRRAGRGRPAGARADRRSYRRPDPRAASDRARARWRWKRSPAPRASPWASPPLSQARWRRSRAGPTGRRRAASSSCRPAPRSVLERMKADVDLPALRRPGDLQP